MSEQDSSISGVGTSSDFTPDFTPPAEPTSPEKSLVTEEPKAPIVKDPTLTDPPAAPEGMSSLADMIKAQGEKDTPKIEGEAPKIEEPKPEEPKVEAKPEAKVEGEESEDDEPEIPDALGLTAEQWTKLEAKMPKWARGQIAKYRELDQSVEALGGVDGLKVIATYADLLSDPNKFAEWETTVEETAPFHLKAIANKVFHNDIQRTEVQDIAIKEVLGDTWSHGRMQELVGFVEDGLIDFDELREKRDALVSKEDREKRVVEAQRNEERDKKQAEVESRLKVREDADAVKAFQDAYKTSHLTLREGPQGWEAVARDKPYGFMPTDKDPEPVVRIKKLIMNDVLTHAENQMKKDPTYQAIYGGVDAQGQPTTGMLHRGETESYAYKLAISKVRNTFRATFKNVANVYAPMFHAYLKSYNQPTAKNLQNLRDDPAGAAAGSSKVISGAGSNGGGDGTIDFDEILQRKIAAEQRGASPS